MIRYAVAWLDATYSSSPELLARPWVREDLSLLSAR